MEKETYVGVTDRYNGVTVDTQGELCKPEDFETRLTDSLEKWRSEGRRCIWFKVNIKDSALVPVLAKEGFNFHHSRGDFVMMYRWLPTNGKNKKYPNSTSNLPPACHTNLGVGGMVFNDKNQLLVVTENYESYVGTHWKLPGGYVERGEDIKDAAMREVKEETGIDSVFESLVTLRHYHNMMFTNSDIYVIVKLRATTYNIEKSDVEIKACKWMDIDEFLNHPQVIDFNKDIVKQALNLEERKIKLNLVKHTGGTLKKPYTSVVIEDL